MEEAEIFITDLDRDRAASWVAAFPEQVGLMRDVLLHRSAVLGANYVMFGTSVIDEVEFFVV